MAIVYFVNYCIKTKYRILKFALFVSLQLSYVTCDSCKRVDELVSRRVVSLQVSYLGRYDSFSPCNAPSLAKLSVYNYRKSRVHSTYDTCSLNLAAIETIDSVYNYRISLNRCMSY